MLSSFFRSSANSDALWERFIPFDYDSMLPASAAPSSSFASKKELFRTLCCTPTAFGQKSIWLDKGSGKKCYHLASRYQSIKSSDGPGLWIKGNHSSIVWNQLNLVVPLDIRLEITASMMSPATTYTAYLVYFIQDDAFFDLNCLLLNVSIGVRGGETFSRTIFLNTDVDPVFHNHRNGTQVFGSNRPKYRSIEGERLEIELGQYFNKVTRGLETVASIQLKAVQTLGSVCIEGVEIRPTTGQ